MCNMSVVQRLTEMKDSGPEDVRARENVQASFRSLLDTFGYRSIDTPILEPTELFLRKSGVEISSHMYSFIDPGGNHVSLRPEFTSSAIRYYVSRQYDEDLPLKLQYSGPVFRYDRSGGYRQFCQLGAELIGDGKCDADIEILGIASAGLTELGLPSFQCVVGNIGLLHSILDCLGLSLKAQNLLISSISDLKSGITNSKSLLENAHSSNLFRNNDNKVLDNEMALADMTENDALSLLQDLFQDSLDGVLGNRSTDEILRRFWHKFQQADDPKRFKDGADILSQLASMSGSPSNVLADIAKILESYSLSQDLLIPISEVVEGFGYRYPSIDLILDPGLVRGITYYTGMVFEIVTSTASGKQILCGGGRYDGLVKSLGGAKDVPALGFAYNVEELLQFLPQKLEDGHFTSCNS